MLVSRAGSSKRLPVASILTVVARQAKVVSSGPGCALQDLTAEQKCDANKPECGPCKKSRYREPCSYDPPPAATINVQIAKKPNESAVASVVRVDWLGVGDTIPADREFGASTFPTSDVSQNHSNMVL